MIFRIFATISAWQNTISSPTKVTASTKTSLNVILASHPERFTSSGTLHLGISDHDLIYNAG